MDKRGRLQFALFAHIILIMENLLTYQLKLSPTVTLTLAALTLQQYTRLYATPNDDIKRPEPPEGFDFDQAMANLESFRKDVADYNSMIRSRQVLQAIGLARIRAFEANLSSVDETKDLKEICSRYAFYDPDLQNTPHEVGLAIFSIVREMNLDGDALMLEADLWLQEQAGLIPAEQVQEVLKRIRHQGEQPSDSGSVGEDQLEADSEEQAKDNLKSVVGAR